MAKWRARHRKATVNAEPVIALEVGMDVQIRKTALVNGGKSGTIFEILGIQAGVTVYRVGFKQSYKWLFVRYTRDEIVEPKGLAWEGNALEKARETSVADRAFTLTFNGQTWS